MDTAIDFKSLRAKFQAEIQSKEKPTVPHKPRRFPLPAGGATSLSVNTSSAGEGNRAPPLGILGEDHKVGPVKRPIPVPPCFFHHGNEGGSVVTRLSLKERQLPLVLPTSSSHEPNHDSAASSTKLVTSPIKCKKKAMPTPFRPSRFSKCIKDIIEGAGEHAVNGSSQNFPVVDSTLNGANGFPYHNGASNSGSECPSPEQAVTPPPTAENSSATHVLSTLEKAKKRFSPKNLLVYARPKSFYASKCPSESPPPSADYENIHHVMGSPSLRSECLPVISPPHAAPSLQLINGLTHSRRPLPDLASLGPLPMKPPRPPHVDLSSYTQTLIPETKTNMFSMKPTAVPENTETHIQDPENPGMPLPHELEAPEFPDFEASVLEALNSNLINLAALELEATEISVPQPDSLLLPPKSDEMDNMDVQDLQRDKEVMQDRVAFPPEVGFVPIESYTGSEMWINSQSSTALEPEVPKPGISEIPMNGAHNVQTDSNSSELPSEPSFSQHGDHYEVCDNVYEEVETVTKFHFGQNSRKRKEPPKNPYADSPVKEEKRISVRPISQRASATVETNGVNTTHWRRESIKKDRSSPEYHEEKELRKKEKQRLEREKKEQKEKEKKHNEMKKKFQISGQEEPMYHARVLVSSKPRKHDLQVKSGDTISIIRTTNCPKGKWLARDAKNKYGYISVMNVELNMKEILELGKRVQAAGRGGSELDTLSLSSRSSHYNPVLTSSFTDDSEEWTVGDETLSNLPESIGPHRAVSMPDMFGGNVSTHNALSAGSMEDLPSQLNHEALQKLAVFFQNSREDLQTASERTNSVPTNFDGPGLPAVEEPPYVEEDQFSFDVELLPPPELYADSL
ncbi:FYN-binding protein 2 isoform X2 [Hoplias malabaricus]|uniref:FYN-binding protein 2 isoform X2 n=1 Tax=Hoplias malabaricus TaxID=27720 RepID=UPI0034636999